MNDLSVSSRLREEGTFLSADGVHEIGYTVSFPSSSPKGIIQLIHGMNECFARYEESGFVSALNDAGYVVCGNDHLGHGRSADGDKTKGHFENYAFLTEDAHSVTALIRKKYRFLPIILFGHSLGSFVIRDYLKKYRDEADGAVLCGSVGTESPVKVGLLLSGFLCLFGKKHPSRLMRGAMFSFLSAKLGQKRKSALSWINSDEEKTALLVGNPLYDFPLTAGAYREVFRLISSVTGENVTGGEENEMTKSVQILLQSGEDDPIGGMGNGISDLYDEYFEYGIDRLEKILYPGCRHEIMNDFQREKMIADLIAFSDSVVESVVNCRTLRGGGFTFER